MIRVYNISKKRALEQSVDRPCVSPVSPLVDDYS